MKKVQETSSMNPKVKYRLKKTQNIYRGISSGIRSPSPYKVGLDNYFDSEVLYLSIITHIIRCKIGNQYISTARGEMQWKEQYC